MDKKERFALCERSPPKRNNRDTYSTNRYHEEDTWEKVGSAIRAADPLNKRNLALKSLLTDAKFTDDIKVSLRILATDVVEQPSAAGDQSEQTASRGKILAMGSHVLGQSIDPFGQNCDLNFGGSGVGGGRTVFADHFLLAFFRDRHAESCFLDESNTGVTCHPRQNQVLVNEFDREV